MFDFLIDILIDFVSCFMPDSWKSKRREKRAQKKADQAGRNVSGHDSRQNQAQGEEDPSALHSLYQATSDTIVTHAADNAELFLADALPNGYGGEIELEELYDNYKDRKNPQPTQRTNTSPHEITGPGGQHVGHHGSYPGGQPFVQGQPGTQCGNQPDVWPTNQPGKQSGAQGPPHNHSGAQPGV